ncbi:hypothetical protein BDZ89DRAFT_1075977 [Hymenopellis radicata]|nr:hypothetical protein BDZ89DRAFT_1075977 [Hymenopellis radicata]
MSNTRSESVLAGSLNEYADLYLSSTVYTQRSSKAVASSDSDRAVHHLHSPHLRHSIVIPLNDCLGSDVTAQGQSAVASR